MQFCKEIYDELSSKYEQCVLRIEHILVSDTTFKLYTSFQNYAAFKAFYNQHVISRPSLMLVRVTT